MDKGHWEFPYEFNIDEWFGFIYRIIELHSGKEYVGKKQFHQYLSKRVAGRKNKVKYKKESDWKKYTSSCNKLKEAIENNGKENYKFLIESLHKTRGSLHYREVETQVTENVLRDKLPSGERKYYNGHIDGVKFLPPEEISEETCMKISHSLRRFLTTPEGLARNQKVSDGVREYYKNNPHFIDLLTEGEKEQWIASNFRGEKNPMYGVESTKKGKTMEELYGVEDATRIKKILSETCGRFDEDNGFFGKTHSEEQKEKWRVDERRIFRGEDNGMFEKPCYYKMTEEEKESWKRNISLAAKDKPKSDKTKEKMKDSWKNDPARKEAASLRRAEMNRTEEARERTKQTNERVKHSRHLKKVTDELSKFQYIIEELQKGQKISVIANSGDYPYRFVWDISKNLNYWINIIQEVLDKQLK